jgi:hypothetical protein
MFGFVVANTEALTDAQLERYKGAYCGLCRTLQKRHGDLSRMTLNYDMTFLVLLLGSMYEPEEQSGAGRCMAHPLHRRSWWTSRFTDYAADMNVALAWHNCMDDWNDEKKLLSLTEAKLLRAQYEKVYRAWPAQCDAIELCMETLRAVEISPEPAPDAAANAFGKLMGELFSVEADSVWNPRFHAFGEALGRFVYMMDACVDLETDRKKGNYNPLLAMYPAGDVAEDEKLELLKMLIAECSAEFERLPLLQDVEILRSVLYSGVWTQYAMKLKKEKGGAAHGQ